jgi:hypothetical protein
MNVVHECIGKLKKIIKSKKGNDDGSNNKKAKS